MSEFVQAIKQRRSIYALGKNPSVGQDSIVKKIEEGLE
jgi:predicted oxidoreductase (fatty acid repression mutant protein)